MRCKLEPQGTDIDRTQPDEVWERGDDGHLHLLDIDALLQGDDSGLLEEE